MARELCQRAGSKAYIAGSIASLGSEYVLGLKAVNCQSGDPLAEQQVTAASKEKVLDALGEAASKLRGELGESLATVQKFDVPLAEATTSSLEALKAYSLGLKAANEKGSAAALPYVQRAIELDPNFAMGYAAVGGDYFNLGELGRARRVLHQGISVAGTCQRTGKAGDHRPLLFDVTGELDKAAQTYQEEIESYPRDSRATCNLGNVYAAQGQYEKAAEVVKPSLAPCTGADGAPYASLANHTPRLAALRRNAAGHPRRRRHENWIISYSTMLSTLLPFSARTQRRWRSSSSGLRASRKRTLGCRLHPTPKRMAVILARRGN